MRAFLALLLVVGGALALPASVGAATTCRLTAATSPGSQILVDGQGFPASTDVTVTTVWGGSSAAQGGSGAGTTTTRTVTTDANGTFTFAVPAGPGRGGNYAFTAEVSGGCTATATAVAIETAGGTAGGVSPTLPPTDSVPGAAPAAPRRPFLPLLALAVGAGLVVLVIGIRRPGRRQTTRR